MRLDLHQRFILHVHFALAFPAAARSMPFRRGWGELRNGTQLDRIGLDLDQAVAGSLRCRFRSCCRSRRLNRFLNWPLNRFLNWPLNCWRSRRHNREQCWLDH